MKTQTRYFGEIDYTKEDILHLPKGLFGFEDKTEYLLIHMDEDENEPLLLCMQSLQDSGLAFILTNPFRYLPDYAPELSREDSDALNLKEDTPVTFYAICVIQEEIRNSTMNLKCPIAINAETRVARQIILDNPSYTFRHSFEALSDSAKEGSDC